MAGMVLASIQLRVPLNDPDHIFIFIFIHNVQKPPPKAASEAQQARLLAGKADYNLESEVCVPCVVATRTTWVAYLGLPLPEVPNCN